MSNNYENQSFKKLLNKLQEESWQLELLISGFAIFGLFTASEHIEFQQLQSRATGEEHKVIIYTFLRVACYILTFSLMVHILLRGLWIGALGLRYVSGDIDYQELNYSEKFTKYLKRKVGSFDKYIATLENYCSIIFAASFLLIFYVLSLTFIIFSIALVGENIMDNDNIPKWLQKAIGIPVLFFIGLGILMTFLDFITQGFLKKKRWLSKIYFPFYRIFSIITLSFLYRPLVYNFLDNKFGKRFSYLLFFAFIAFVFVASIKFNTSNYIHTSDKSNSYIANNRNYLDLIDEKTVFIKSAAIQSKVIEDNYLKVFIPYSKRIENRIFNYNKSLKPEKDKRGLDSDIIVFNNNSKKNLDSLRREYLKTFNAIYYAKIDTTIVKTEFIIGRSPKGNLGFETYLPVKHLTEGRHAIEVKRKYLNTEAKDTLYYRVAKIPFWYFPD